MTPTTRDRTLNWTCGALATVLMVAGLVTAVVMGLIALYLSALGILAWAVVFWAAAGLSAVAPFLFLHSYDEWQKKNGLTR